MSAAGTSDAASHFGQLRLGPDGSPDMYGLHNEEGALGGPPWERPFDYVAASPIFFLDRVETPLLLIYGTEDDAVGVEQGGEMLSASAAWIKKSPSCAIAAKATSQRTTARQIAGTSWHVCLPGSTNTLEAETRLSRPIPKHATEAHRGERGRLAEGEQMMYNHHVS